jgi:broad specificity phosphatase PhoE
MPFSMPGRLVLVRHGESTWNAAQLLQGQLDPPLSAVGRAQARGLARLVGGLGLPPERVVCSDLGRARETAELMGLAPGRYDPAWREIDVGEWGRRPAAEVDAEGIGLANWRGGPRTAPSGEPWAAFAERVAGAVDRLAAQGGDWLVVCHGGCIRAACAHVTGADRLSLGSPSNASVTTVELGERPRLMTYGVTPDGKLPTGVY